MRRAAGHTLLEMMVVIGLVAIALGLLYNYKTEGWHLYNKTFQFGLLQRNARVALQAMSDNIRQASKNHIFTDDGFSLGVPFPDDALTDKPYIYFAKPNVSIEGSKSEPASAKPKDKNTDKSQMGILSEGKQFSSVDSYDYYLYYFAMPERSEAEAFQKLRRAKLKLLRIKNQSAFYTDNPPDEQEWPFLPPEYVEKVFPDEKNISSTTFMSNVKYETLTPEFDTYKSDFIFDYSGSDYAKLFNIEVHMYHEPSDTYVEFSTAVTPRN